jgi:hypothetical protein
MGGECPLNCVRSNYLAFISHVETKATLRGVIGIAPRNLLTPFIPDGFILLEWRFFLDR